VATRPRASLHFIPAPPKHAARTAAPAGAECTELYLGGERLEQLSGFGPLVNLERLWLNDNQLRAITGLDANVRLKELYVQVRRRAAGLTGDWRFSRAAPSQPATWVQIDSAATAFQDR
jgi:hypothetical protein